jgi:hypothetical protein
MKDKALLKFVTGFRKGMLAKRAPNGMCYAVCSPLQSLLLLSGINTELVECSVLHTSWDHFYLELEDGRILDPTASQFNKPNGEAMPDIYLGEKPDWYIFDNVEA